MRYFDTDVIDWKRCAREIQSSQPWMRHTPLIIRSTDLLVFACRQMLSTTVHRRFVQSYDESCLCNGFPCCGTIIVTMISCDLHYITTLLKCGISIPSTMIIFKANPAFWIVRPRHTFVFSNTLSAADDNRAKRPSFIHEQLLVPNQQSPVFFGKVVIRNGLFRSTIAILDNTVRSRLFDRRRTSTVILPCG